MATERLLKAKRLVRGCLALVALCTTAVAAFAETRTPPERLLSAQIVGQVQGAQLLAVARAGKRLVAVGDHGIVLLTDDEGKHWVQSRQVPFDGLLTAVSFVDASRGWAVGHAGVIMRTDNAGETWALQRSDTAQDRPLFSVHFFDADRGVAVGLWSIVLITDDGGRTWIEQTLQPPPGARKADLNLFGLFSDAKGRLFAAAERGMVLRSDDKGRTWQYLNTGYAGSLWTGLALDARTLLVAGLRGSIYRSSDEGKTWTRVDSTTSASITSLVVRSEADPASEVVGVALDGTLIRSSDGGRTFASTGPARGRSLTAAAPTTGDGWLLLSRDGPVPR